MKYTKLDEQGQEQIRAGRLQTLESEHFSTLQLIEEAKVDPRRNDDERKSHIASLQEQADALEAKAKLYR